MIPRMSLAHARLPSATRASRAWLQRWWPAGATVNATERWRACVGAMIGIFVTGLIGAAVVGPGSVALWLMAPMGASAVLLFAVPASPLAQPWSVVGGNTVAALIGVTCAKLIGAPAAAAAAAIFLAIGAMFLLRCLHPPSGAVTVMAVLGGPEVHAAGYGFVLAPVALNSLSLLLVALAYNNLTGRAYPHGQQAESPKSPAAPRLGFTSADLQAVLKDYNQVLDVSADDLAALFRQTEVHAYRRRFGDTRCRDIMRRAPPAVVFATELDEAWDVMRSHQVQALPVIDRARRVIGVVTRADFLRHADERQGAALGARLHALLRRTPGSHSDKPEVVGQIMTAPALTVPDGEAIAALVPIMLEGGHHHVPVVDSDRRLVGMVNQSELVAALYETTLATLADPGPPARPAGMQDNRPPGSAGVT